MVECLLSKMLSLPRREKRKVKGRETEGKEEVGRDGRDGVRNALLPLMTSTC